MHLHGSSDFVQELGPPFLLPFALAVRPLCAVQMHHSDSAMDSPDEKDAVFALAGLTLRTLAGERVKLRRPLPTAAGTSWKTLFSVLLGLAEAALGAPPGDVQLCLGSRLLDDSPHTLATLRDVLASGTTELTCVRRAAGFLRPSCADFAALDCSPHSPSGGSACPLTVAGLLPCAEIQRDLDGDEGMAGAVAAAVCMMCFGQERRGVHYILLAAAFGDGAVAVYRCLLTEAELAQQEDSAAGPAAATSNRSPSSSRSPGGGGSSAEAMTVHSRMVGHSCGVASLCFGGSREDWLVTSSTDKSVRVWCVDSGHMLRSLLDTSPVWVAACLPRHPEILVLASGGAERSSPALLRLAGLQDGLVLQCLELGTEVTSLRFDDTALTLFAGTARGGVHAMQISGAQPALMVGPSTRLPPYRRVTCMAYAPAAHGSPEYLLVATSDVVVSVIDCVRGQDASSGAVTRIDLRRRVPLPAGPLARAAVSVQCCYSLSSGNPAYLLMACSDSGVRAWGEDGVLICPLIDERDTEVTYLKHPSQSQRAPVCSIALNLQDTLLASADASGCIVLWRRVFPSGAQQRLAREPSPETRGRETHERLPHGKRGGYPGHRTNREVLRSSMTQLLQRRTPSGTVAAPRG